jgi:hypothetical protein
MLDEEIKMNSKKQYQTIQQARQRIYELYQLDWLMSHGYSLFDVVRGIASEAVEVDRENDGIDSIKQNVECGIHTWMESVGLDDTCWACYDEFFDYEYQDASYIKSLVQRQSRDSAILLSLYRDDEKNGFPIPLFEY